VYWTIELEDCFACCVAQNSAFPFYLGSEISREGRFPSWVGRVGNGLPQLSFPTRKKRICFNQRHQRLNINGCVTSLSTGEKLRKRNW
jgi:hypothetical protein